MSTNQSQVWRTIRCMDGSNPPVKKNETLTINGISYVEGKNKENQFGKTYREFARLPAWREDSILRRKVRNRLKIKPPGKE